MDDEPQKPALPWWGRFALGIGERGLWHVGPMRLGLARQRQELSVDYRQNAEPRDARFFECPTTATLDGSGVVRNRYAFAETPEIVWVRPALPISSRPPYPPCICLNSTRGLEESSSRGRPLSHRGG